MVGDNAGSAIFVCGGKASTPTTTVIKVVYFITMMLSDAFLSQ